MEAIALMFEATLDCYQRRMKSDDHTQKCLELLEKVFKDFSYNIVRSTLKVKIKSMSQEFHATFCDADLDHCKSDELIDDRIHALKQQLQHQMNDECQFDAICPCLRHSLSPPCEIKNHPWRHMSRCGASNHIMTDEHCANHHVGDEKF